MAIPPRLNNNAEVLAELEEFGYVDSGNQKIGDLSEGGLRLATNTDRSEVRSGSQKGVYAHVDGQSTTMLNGELLNVNVNNVAFAYGLDEDAANITGSGNSGDPYTLVVDPEKLGEQAARTYYAAGTRQDAQIIRFEGTGRVVAPSVEMTFAQGSATLIPFQLEIEGTFEFQQYSV